MFDILSIVAALFLTTPAQAQNVLCPTRPANDNSNACANTAWVKANGGGGGGGGSIGTGVQKGNGSGGFALATPSVDYLTPIVNPTLPNWATLSALYSGVRINIGSMPNSAMDASAAGAYGMPQGLTVNLDLPNTFVNNNFVSAAVAGYARNGSPTVAGSGVGLFGVGMSNTVVDGGGNQLPTANWGLNTICSNTPATVPATQTGLSKVTCFSLEADVNWKALPGGGAPLTGASGGGFGMGIFGGAEIKPGPFAQAFQIGSLSQTSPNTIFWDAGLVVQDATNTDGIILGAKGAGINNVGSMPLRLNSRTAGGVNLLSRIYTDPTGSIILSPNDGIGGIISLQDGLGTPLLTLSDVTTAFANTPTAPTMAIGDNSTHLATTAWVQANAGGGGGSVTAVIGLTGSISRNALASALALTPADMNAGTFTGIYNFSTNNTATFPYNPPLGTIVQLGALDGGITRLLLDSWGTGVSSNLTLRSARGTGGAPTASQLDDALGTLAFQGYGTSYALTSRATVSGMAAENWTNTANGTYLRFSTTLIGTTTLTERMRITDAGVVRVAGLASGGTQCLQADTSGNIAGTGSACGGGGGAVSSVSNSDGTLTISPTTGAVVGSLALGHANTWTGAQTFGIGNLKLAGSGGANQVLQQISSGGAVTVGQLSTSNLSDGPLTATLASVLYPLAPSKGNLAAAGTTQSGATLIATSVVNVNSGTGGVKLPVTTGATAGLYVVVFNNNAASINVYPNGILGQINKVTSGAAVVLTTGQTAIFYLITPLSGSTDVWTMTRTS